MYIEIRVPDLHSADGWKTVKEKFLTYFNPIGSTKEPQMYDKCIDLKVDELPISSEN